eukprot:4960158-Pyramimonas_sp.AAC.1
MIEAGGEQDVDKLLLELGIPSADELNRYALLCRHASFASPRSLPQTRRAPRHHSALCPLYQAHHSRRSDLVRQVAAPQAKRPAPPD